MFDDKPPSDWAELDGKTPLSEREIKALRRILLQHEREEWARRRLRVILPWLVGAVGAAWAVIEWAMTYIQWKGKS